MSPIPFKSKAQQRLLEMKAAKGQFGKGNIEEWEKSTDFSKLPEHVKPSKKVNRKRTKVKGKAKRGRGY